jgi:hypothetical protein
MWVISLVSYVIQMNVEASGAAFIVNSLTGLLMILFALVGVIQCNALYSRHPVSDLKAMKIMLSKVWITLLTLAFYCVIWLFVAWFLSHGLQSVYKPGSVFLGLVRIVLGFSYLFFFTATFLILPLQMMTQKKTSHLVKQLLKVGTSHWVRCFLCLFSWSVILELLTGNLAFVLLPALIKVPFSINAHEP